MIIGNDFNPRLFFFILTMFSLMQLSVAAQDASGADSGIFWESSLTLDQLKSKAKVFNKHIFIDVYATWCGPCKLMEKEVFSTQDVSRVINENCISVRVQADKTDKDNENIRKWTRDTEKLIKQYSVNAYPTFLFISPSGVLTYKEVGYKRKNDFITMVLLAIKPGQVYKNPFEKYDKLVREFRAGKRTYQEMPYLIQTSTEKRDMLLKDSLWSDYVNYLNQKDPWFLFKKNIVKVIADNIKTSKDPFFKLFYPNGSKVDKIMSKATFSRNVVDKIIEKEITQPLMNEFVQKNSFKDVKEKGIEPNWDSILEKVNREYGLIYAERAVRSSKFNFYWSIQDDKLLVKSFKEQLNNNDLDTASETVKAYMNSIAWRVFLKSTDRDDLMEAVEWAKNVADYFSSPACYDTYANLLYKVFMLYGIGKKNDAIALEELAIYNAVKKSLPDKSIQEYKNTIENMRNDKPTWK
jgi:thioredoxin-related protein